MTFYIIWNHAEIGHGRTLAAAQKQAAKWIASIGVSFDDGIKNGTYTVEKA